MRFVITAGGTREYIDPVRFISNASSGKMGYALARAALRAGHKVTLITAATGLRKPAGATVIGVETAEEMFESVKRHFGRCDCLIMAAAVADYTPARAARTKIKKSWGPFALKLKPTADILKWAGKNKKKGQIVVGFVLEDKALRPRAEEKMREKNLDMVVANSPDAIGSDRTEVHIKLRGTGWMELRDSTKTAVARRIIKLVETCCP